MRQRRSRSDDVLFISALAAVLVGIALLLVTTGAFKGAFRVWPLLVMAVGGGLIYVALIRRPSPAFLFGGISFVLEGSFFLVALLARLSMRRAWPFAMVTGGVAGIVAGMVAWRRPRPHYLVPSISFILLGALFALFSFDVAAGSFREFIVTWWPSLLILGGILLFVAFGLKRGRAGRSQKDRVAVDARAPRDPERGP